MKRILLSQIKTTLLVSVTLVFSFCVFAKPYSYRPVGIELEYLGKGTAAQIQNPDTWMKILGIVQQIYGGTPIVFKKWDHYGTKDLFYAEFQDPFSRTWKLVPELMNRGGGGFNGYELVTPPLTNWRDEEKMARVVVELQNSGLLKQGYSSSTHMTYEISHLFGFASMDEIRTKNLNISKVVDLILFIESRMPEIVHFIAPKRQGHTINYYTVPLSFGQKWLLDELAKMPEESRTFLKVRELFLSYEERELKANGGREVAAWKFRAVNYAKFFGLGRFDEFLPVFEFRLADLAETPQELERLDALYSRIIDVGSRTQSREFKNPFKDFPPFEEQSKVHFAIDRLIRNLPEERANSFLLDLGLSPKEFVSRYRPQTLTQKLCRIFLN